MAIPFLLKKVAGTSVHFFHPLARYEKCLFLIGRMRCGSTALSNILFSRKDINGYGESHIRYDSRTTPGALALNLMRRNAWSPNADWVFDKILHNRLDAMLPDEFFEARAIFMVRDPAESIPSIVRLFKKIGSTEYKTSDEAAGYYIERLKRLSAVWPRFSPRRRTVLTYESLIEDSDAALNHLTKTLGLSSPLQNIYQIIEASNKRGAGDPINAQRYTAIISGGIKNHRASDAYLPKSDLLNQATGALQRFKEISTGDKNT